MGPATLETVVFDLFERGDVVLRQRDGAGTSEHGVEVGRRWPVAVRVRVGYLVGAAGDEVTGGSLDLKAEALVGGRVAEETLLSVEWF